MNWHAYASLASSNNCIPHVLHLLRYSAVQSGLFWCKTPTLKYCSVERRCMVSAVRVISAVFPNGASFWCSRVQDSVTDLHPSSDIGQRLAVGATLDGVTPASINVRCTAYNRTIGTCVLLTSANRSCRLTHFSGIEPLHEPLAESITMRHTPKHVKGLLYTDEEQDKSLKTGTSFQDFSKDMASGTRGSNLAQPTDDKWPWPATV